MLNYLLVSNIIYIIIYSDKLQTVVSISHVSLCTPLKNRYWKVFRILQMPNTKRSSLRKSINTEEYLKRDQWTCGLFSNVTNSKIIVYTT